MDIYEAYSCPGASHVNSDTDGGCFLPDSGDKGIADTFYLIGSAPGAQEEAVAFLIGKYFLSHRNSSFSVQDQDTGK